MDGLTPEQVAARLGVSISRVRASASYRFGLPKQIRLRDGAFTVRPEDLEVWRRFFDPPTPQPSHAVSAPYQPEVDSLSSRWRANAHF